MPFTHEPEDDDDREPVWEAETRQILRDIIDRLAFDEGRDRVVLTETYDDSGETRSRTFSNVGELRRALTAMGNEEMLNYLPFEGGEPVFEADSSAIVEELIESEKVDDFFKSTPVPPDNLLLDLNAAEVTDAELVVEAVSDELIKYLARHPEKMREMSPRKFEELVAELFNDMGYEVELTAPSRDGGRDVLALRKDDATRLLTLVECKRYAEDKKVGVGLVRQLYGVVSDERASHGVIASTTFFTRGAKEMALRLRHRLSLKNYDDLVGWLNNYKKARR